MLVIEQNNLNTLILLYFMFVILLLNKSILFISNIPCLCIFFSIEFLLLFSFSQRPIAKHSTQIMERSFWFS